MILEFQQKLIRKIYNPEKQHLIAEVQVDHPYFLEAVLVHKENEPVGMCLVFNNPNLVHKNKKAACFGFFECVDHQDVCRKLMEATIKCASKFGAEYLIGPMHGSTWNSYRFSEHAFDDPFLGEFFHASYYANLLMQSGFQRIERYETRADIDLNLLADDVVKKAENHLKSINIAIRNLDLTQFQEDLKLIHEFSLSSFSSNVFYTPISQNQFLAQYLKLKPFIDPKYVFLAFEGKELVGLVFAYPDILIINEKRLVLKTIAKKPGLRYAGITHVVGNQIINYAKDDGISVILHAYMHTSNNSTNVSKKFSGEVYRTYSLFGLDIEINLR